MPEIEFLQSGSGLDIAIHAPCAIDSGFESLEELHHLLILGCPLVDPGLTGRHYPRDR